MSPHIARMLKAYDRGEVSRRQLADHLKAESTSVTFESLLEYFRGLWPDAKLLIRRGSVPVARVCPAQSQLNRDKHRLVRALFDSQESFEAINAEFFPHNPISVLAIRDGRYAILDGHHRVLRWYELAGDAEPLPLTVVGTHNVELCNNYRRQIEAVARATGSYHIKDLPIV